MPKNCRNGQSLFTMWIEDPKRAKWEEACKAVGKSSLAKFVKEVVDSHITRSEVMIVQDSKGGSSHGRTEKPRGEGRRTVQVARGTPAEGEARSSGGT
jgi:hypothetical protein